MKASDETDRLVHARLIPREQAWAEIREPYLLY
jgi:hypothetical protein